MTCSAGPPTLSRAITRSTRIGRPFADGRSSRRETSRDTRNYTRADGRVLKTLFWGSLGALAWTHVGYPLAAGALARAAGAAGREGPCRGAVGEP